MTKKKGNRRKKILLLHRVLGLLTGCVLFVVSITGCLWVFKEEVESFYSDYKQVVPEAKERITASEVRQIAERIIPDKTIHGVVYGTANEAIEVVFYEATPVEFYQSVFLNPYSGVFIKRIDHQAGFFGFVLRGHLRLWLPETIGSRVVSYSVLLFIVLLISGLFLWLPKSTKNWRQRLQFIWNPKTRWKRKNFDLHTIVGFYVSSFGLVLAFTGCVMAFNWFYFITYKVTGGDKDPRFVIPESSVITAVVPQRDTPAYDQLLPMLYKTHKGAKSFELHYPENDTTAILVEVSNSKGLYYDMDYLFFDQYTLQEIKTPSIYGTYTSATFADKVIRMNYDIHIGAIGGIVGKIIAFLASLICGSLPVTGILLWYGKRYKKKQQQHSNQFITKRHMHDLT